MNEIPFLDIPGGNPEEMQSSKEIMALGRSVSASAAASAMGLPAVHDKNNCNG